MRELQQRCGRATTRLSTFVAAEPAGQVVHKSCRRGRQFSKINILSGVAAGALDLNAVDCLIDRGRGIDGLAVRPHALIPAFAEEAIGLLDQCFAFSASRCGLRCQNGGHRACFAELLP